MDIPRCSNDITIRNSCANKILYSSLNILEPPTVKKWCDDDLLCWDTVPETLTLR